LWRKRTGKSHLTHVLSERKEKRFRKMLGDKKTRQQPPLSGLQVSEVRIQERDKQTVSDYIPLKYLMAINFTVKRHKKSICKCTRNFRLYKKA
jgi:hypothetical protein